jgi:hypothetical protein
MRMVGALVAVAVSVGLESLLQARSHELRVALGFAVPTIVFVTILGFVLPKPAGSSIAVYDMVSKPFLQLRQTGWMLAYMVMPAVASLAAANDDRTLDRVKYDGARLHLAALLPVAGQIDYCGANAFLDAFAHSAATRSRCRYLAINWDDWREVV